jgi:hypothetical protein
MSGEWMTIKRDLEEEESSGSIYLPFVSYGSTGTLRAFQSYLTKLRRAVIDAIPEFGDLAAAAEASAIADLPAMHYPQRSCAQHRAVC